MSDSPSPNPNPDEPEVNEPRPAGHAPAATSEARIGGEASAPPPQSVGAKVAGPATGHTIPTDPITFTGNPKKEARSPRSAPGSVDRRPLPQSVSGHGIPSEEHVGSPTV